MEKTEVSSSSTVKAAPSAYKYQTYCDVGESDKQAWSSEANIT